MPHGKALDKKKLWKEITRQHKKDARAKIADLRARLREARAARKTGIVEAKTACRTGRLQARERVKDLRARVLAELRELAARERGDAREACRARKLAARELGTVVLRRREELAAERAYRKDLRRLEQANKARHKERVTAKERRAESDDEVRQNIPPEMLSLFERVKRQIKGSARMSRTEAFLHYAEEHPGEVLAALDDRTDALIAELEKDERRARRDLRRGPPRRKYTPEELAEVPF